MNKPTLFLSLRIVTRLGLWAVIALNDSKKVESQVPTTWVGTLTGNINQANGTAAFTADSTQTQKYLIDGSIRVNLWVCDL